MVATALEEGKKRDARLNPEKYRERRKKGEK